jgi:hypothetical protein
MPTHTAGYCLSTVCGKSVHNESRLQWRNVRSAGRVGPAPRGLGEALRRAADPAGQDGGGPPDQPLVDALIAHYRAGVPLDLGPMVGEPAFEQARGVLMQLCGYSAEDALGAISEAAKTTGTAPQSLVAIIRSKPSFAVVRFDLCTSLSR